MSENNFDQSISEALKGAQENVDAQNVLHAENQRLKAENARLQAALDQKIDRRSLFRRGAQSFLGLATLGTVGKLGLEAKGIRNGTPPPGTLQHTPQFDEVGQIPSATEDAVTSSTPETGQEYRASGFHQIGDGVELTPFDIAAFIRRDTNRLQTTGLSDTKIEYSFSLVFPDSNGVTPQMNIKNGWVTVKDAQISSRTQDLPYVRLETLPPSTTDASPTKVVLTTTYGDGRTSSEDIEPSLKFPSVQYSLPGQNAILYSSDALPKDINDQFYQDLSNAASFVGTKMDGKVYDNQTSPYEETRAIPDYIRRIGGNDAVFPRILTDAAPETRQAGSYYEATRSILQKIANDPQMAGDKQDQINALLNGYKNYIEGYRNTVTQTMSNATQDMIEGRVKGNPLFRYYDIRRYFESSVQYKFGDIVNNPVDFIASALTVWNFYGDEFSKKLQIAKESTNVTQDEQLGYHEAVAMADNLFGLLDLINHDKEAQHAYVAKLSAVKI